MKTLMRSASLALLALAVCVPSAGAETTKCQRAIAKANSQFLQARVKAIDKCNQGVVKSGTGSCPDAKASASITKAEGKLLATIAKACGGDDKICGGNTNNEDTPVSLGWPSVCPNFEKGTCTNAIADCSDIATCLACLGTAASDQAMGLYYGALNLPSGNDKTLNKCQIAIGKASSAFLNAQAKSLQKCWDARLNGKHTQDCFAPNAGDGKYAAAIQKAKEKQLATICKACGGSDKACGGAADLTPAAIGFVSDCSLVTRPHGGPGCSGPITNLQDIVDCTACVTQYKAECTGVAPVPQYEAYPAECNACTEPAPTGACPSVISFTADGPNVELDTGFSGLAHDAQVPTNGRITLNVTNCDSANHPGCGECDVDGPIENDGGVTFDNHRCQDAPWVQCSVDADCTATTQCVGGSNNGALCTNPGDCPGSNCNGGTNNGAVCTTASECPGGTCDAATCVNAGFSGPCIYFFGAPLPLRAGGVSTCVVNEISGPVSGTINVDDGTSTTNVPLSSKVYPVGTEFAPCPRCEGGTCQSGPRTGQACTVNGTGQFGDVSLDCPPNPGSLAGALGINLNIATGVQTRTLSAASPNCRDSGYPGLKCHCDTCNNVSQDACATNADCPVNFGGPGICGGRRCLGGTEAGQPCRTCIGGTNHSATCADSSSCPGGTCANPRVCEGGANDGNPCNNNSACPGGICAECQGGGQCNVPGEATKPNDCLDDTTTVGLDCDPLSGDPDNGECTAGPVDLVCSIQTFRSCTTDAQCNPPANGGTCNECTAGQTCIARNRPCFTDNGEIGASIDVQGSPDAPCGGVSKPTVGTFFCVAPVGATAVNASGGLPALGRVRIPGTVLIDP